MGLLELIYRVCARLFGATNAFWPLKATVVAAENKVVHPLTQILLIDC